jgi:threonine dehydrogenase-like Zn-dependent dehydrogenase
MIFGLTDPACEVPVKPYEMFKKELTIKASFINPYTFERSISLLTSGKINVKEIITDIVKLEDINKVFEDEGYRKRGKVIIC